MAKIMAINAGSSSLKFKLYEMPREQVLTSGIVEKIGHDDAIFTLKHQGEKINKILPIKDHAEAVKLMLDELINNHIISSYDEIKATGHRIVQGGKYFKHSEIFNEDVEAKIESLIPLAPLHNAAHLIGYRAFKKILPNIGAVAVFDTAFHMTMQEEDYIFPIPYEYSEKYDIRRYGAHGTSHHYLALESKKYLNDVKHPKIITCHIGSGASISAIKDYQCVATSMGLTPLGGIMMGTRTGDLDPSVMKYCCYCENKSAEEMFQIFNKKSGLLGVSGVSNDSRDVLSALENGNKRAILAYKLFIRRICDFIGQYYVRLGGCDLIVFSAGIGENSPETRTMIIEQIKDALHVEIDEKLNSSLRGKEGLISTSNSQIKVAVIPTDEEVMIARDTYNLLLKGN